MASSKEFVLESADKEKLEDAGFLTAMMLTLLGNYAQTGHYGGPLSYTPANVALHLLGPKLGGLAYDIRNPKHPLTDKFMLAGGHCIPTCYALWIILYEAMARQFQKTKDSKYEVDPKIAMLSIDVLGFRRTPGAVKTLLKDNGLEEHEVFAQHKIRGIRALMGHAETTDVTNDVNGGPSGIGVANAAGKALFWDFVGAPESLKVYAFEGEFAFTEGHAQELKTMALAQQVGKRMRLFFSNNNAGIDDKLVGGVIHEKYAEQYDIEKQFSSYAWNTFSCEDGANYEQLAEVFHKMEHWPLEDRRPMVVIANTIKGWWPAATDSKVDGDVDQIISYKSHPYSMKTNDFYFCALASSFEKKFGVKFEGIRDGAPSSEADRLVQFKRNVDIALSVLDKGLGEWIATRLLDIAGQTLKTDEANLRLPVSGPNPFDDQRLKVENLPRESTNITITHPTTKKELSFKVDLFKPAGVKQGTRRAISELGKWINYVTGNRFITVAADLSSSINVENCNLTGHYDPNTNPQGTRLKAAIQECVNAATICGLASQTISDDPDVHHGVMGVSGTYGAFTPLMYLPLRIFSQQNQDSPFKLGTVTVIAGHSGPETAADARSHFGIFSPQVWTLFPKGQIINLYMWDYNDVAPAYFAALDASMRIKEVGIIVIHVARPDMVVADRTKFADTDVAAAAKGAYIIKDYDPDLPKSGVVITQGSSSTVNLVSILPRLQQEKLNVKIVAVVSEDLFRLQSAEYQKKVISDAEKFDAMVLTTMTKRISPLSGLGPLTEEFTLSSDFDDRWRSGGLEHDVIREAQLDPESIYEGVKKFALSREDRLARQRSALSTL